MDTSLEEAKRLAAAALSRPVRLGNANKLVDLNNYVAPKAISRQEILPKEKIGMRLLIHHANPYYHRGGGSTFLKVAAVLQTTQLSTNNNDNNNKCHLPRLFITWSKCNNSNIINNVMRYLLLQDL